MYQQPYGYGGAPGLAPGLSAPSGYQNPPLIPPNFNFNAPVIHFGQTLSGATTISTPQPSTVPAAPVVRPTFVQETETPRLPPTAEDLLHTVFIGDIPDDLSDEWMERIVRSLGKLKDWRRAKDGDNKLRPFGFAIFEDAESTNRAFRMLEELEIPNVHGTKASKIIVRIDESTVDYLATLGTGQGATDTDRDLDTRSYLARVVEELKDPSKRQIQSKTQNQQDTATKTLDVDEADYEPADKSGMTVLVGGEEDSGSMPLAQREIILKEIAAFRDRSNRRERNKTWIEEEEKARIERDNSPMQSEPRRRDRNTENNEEKRAAKSGSAQDSIPSGPAADRRKARDYNQSVKFRSSSDRYDRDEDDDIPDDELERRRLERKRRDIETNFVDRERKWLSREKMRTSALEREMSRNQSDDRPVIDKETIFARLAKWDDDIEAERQVEDYYKDRLLWARKRVEFRRKESEKDDRDREAEEREARKDRTRAEALADSFLDEIGAKVSPNVSGIAQPLRLRMTRENVKTAPASPAKRTVEEVEGLLEEDEEEDYQAKSKKKRLLIPLEYDGDSRGDNSSKQRPSIELDIPSDKEGLWKYPVHWEGLKNSIIEQKVRPFATKKVIEAFGVQEQDLIDFVVDHISSHGSAEKLAEELEMTLDEEAEPFVIKMWRMFVSLIPCFLN